MAEIIVWISVGISFFLAIIKIFEFIINIKGAKLTLSIESINGKLIKIDDVERAALKFEIIVANKGNKEEGVDLVVVTHNENEESSSLKYIASNFKVHAKESKIFPIYYSPRYIPRKLKSHEEIMDFITISLEDYSGKKISKEIYYRFPNGKEGNVIYSYTP